MKTAARQLAMVITAVFFAALAMGAIAAPSSASEGDDVDQAAVAELQRALKELNYEGDISEEALRKEFDSSPGAQTYGSSSSGVRAFAAPDGCSTPKAAKVITEKWDEAFDKVCNLHDKCYSKASPESRKACDSSFRSSMKDVCVVRDDINLCETMADVYYYAVRAFGASHYKGAGGPE